MSQQAPLTFGFWQDIVPMATAFALGMVLMAVALVLVVGIVTAPLGLLLTGVRRTIRRRERPQAPREAG